MSTKLHRKTFFDSIRASLFPNGMTQSQVDGFNYILEGWEKRYPTGDLRWLAYELATTQWETAHTIQPIEEYGRGSGKSYGVPDPETGQTYYGRGYVQLTWRENYQKMCAPTGCDLDHEPSLALKPDIAAIVLFDGMEKGTFTGKKNSDYFNANVTDWTNARRIINGTDHASEIAGLAQDYHAAVKAAAYEAPEKPAAPVVAPDLIARLEKRIEILEERLKRFEAST
jgi:putative chitinase